MATNIAELQPRQPTKRDATPMGHDAAGLLDDLLGSPTAQESHR